MQGQGVCVCGGGAVPGHAIPSDTTWPHEVFPVPVTPSLVPCCVRRPLFSPAFLVFFVFLQTSGGNHGALSINSAQLINYWVDVGLGAGAGWLPGLPGLESCCNQAWRALLFSKQSGRLSPCLQAAWRGDWLTLIGKTSFFFPRIVHCNPIRRA